MHAASAPLFWKKKSQSYRPHFPPSSSRKHQPDDSLDSKTFGYISAFLRLDRKRRKVYLPAQVMMVLVASSLTRSVGFCLRLLGLNLQHPTTTGRPSRHSVGTNPKCAVAVQSIRALSAPAVLAAAPRGAVMQKVVANANNGLYDAHDN